MARLLDKNPLTRITAAQATRHAWFNDLIKKIINKKIRGEIFNVGTGKPKNVKKVIELIKKKIKGGRPLYGKIPLRKDEILKLYPKITKAKKLLGWTPKISFNRGIEKTINYYKQNETR